MASIQRFRGKLFETKHIMSCCVLLNHLQLKKASNEEVKFNMFQTNSLIPSSKKKVKIHMYVATTTKEDKFKPIFLRSNPYFKTIKVNTYTL